MHSLHSPAYRAFVARFRRARLAAGLQQQAVAKALGWPNSRLSRMETGERRVDVVELDALAKLYRKPLRWFVE